MLGHVHGSVYGYARPKELHVHVQSRTAPYSRKCKDHKQYTNNSQMYLTMFWPFTILTYSAFQSLEPRSLKQHSLHSGHAWFSNAANNQLNPSSHQPLGRRDTLAKLSPTPKDLDQMALRLEAAGSSAWNLLETTFPLNACLCLRCASGTALHPWNWQKRTVQMSWVNLERWQIAKKTQTL